MSCSLCLSNFPCNLLITFNPGPLKFQDLFFIKALEESQNPYRVFEREDELEHR